MIGLTFAGVKAARAASPSVRKSSSDANFFGGNAGCFLFVILPPRPRHFLFSALLCSGNLARSASDLRLLAPLSRETRSRDLWKREREREREREKEREREREGEKERKRERDKD